MLTRTTLLLLAACTWLAVRLIQSAQRRRKLPPGPPGWPIIGSVLSWPQKEKWWTFMEWAREYGALVSLLLHWRKIVAKLSRQAT
jgi:hypothetical protein